MSLMNFRLQTIMNSLIPKLRLLQSTFSYRQLLQFTNSLCQNTIYTCSGYECDPNLLQYHPNVNRKSSSAEPGSMFQVNTTMSSKRKIEQNVQQYDTRIKQLFMNVDTRSIYTNKHKIVENTCRSNAYYIYTRY